MHRKTLGEEEARCSARCSGHSHHVLGDRAGPFAAREVDPRETLPDGSFVRVGKDCLACGREPELGVREHSGGRGQEGTGGSWDEGRRRGGRQGKG